MWVSQWSYTDKLPRFMLFSLRLRVCTRDAYVSAWLSRVLDLERLVSVSLCVSMLCLVPRTRSRCLCFPLCHCLVLRRLIVQARVCSLTPHPHSQAR